MPFMRFKTVLTACSLAALWMSLASAAPLEGETFLWEIRSDSCTVYLLGSIHIADQRIYPLKSSITNAFAASKALVVEVDVTDLDATESGYIFSNAFYTGEADLLQHLSAESRQMLKKSLRRYGVQLEQVRKMKPWFLANMLVSAELAKHGMRPENGIDYHFLHLAKKRGLPVLELESIREQIDLFEELVNTREDLLLRYLLGELATVEAEMNELLNAWKNGDVEKLYGLLNQQTLNDPELKPVNEMLFTQRNLKMAAKIERFLAKETTLLIIVGAGHLVGQDGIVQLLRDKGYRARRF